MLCRMHGQTSTVIVPEQVDGYRVAAIGAYCFSDRERVPEGVFSFVDTTGGTENLRPLCGDFVEQIILPDSIRRIDNAAFFGCRKLTSIEIGRGSLQMGSDVFNNCSRCQTTVVRGTSSEAGGVRQILSRVSWDMEVRFEDAVLFYPEYNESYDTIAPAHIFGLNIEGEGFRARQCFRGDSVDFAGYDGVFGKACAEETVRVLGRMALDRLMTPRELSDSHRKSYEGYVAEHGAELAGGLVSERELEGLEFLCANRYISSDALEQAVARAVGEDWGEGAASLMEWKHRYFPVDKKRRYEF